MVMEVIIVNCIHSADNNGIVGPIAKTCRLCERTSRQQQIE